MTYSLLSETTPRAVKEHRCIWCGEQIAVGNLYVRERSVYDGHMQNFAWHRECRRDSQKHFTSYEEEFEPFENTRPDYRLVEPTPLRSADT